MKVGVANCGYSVIEKMMLHVCKQVLGLYLWVVRRIDIEKKRNSLFVC